MTGAVRSAVGLFGPTNAFDPFGPFGTLTSFGIEVPQGDPTAIAHAASVLQTLSGALTDQGKSITGAAQTAAKWQGQAASAYAEYSSHVAGACSGNAGACQDAATALQTFSVALATAQRITSQAAGDFNTAANEMTQHQQVATAAGITAQTARLQAVSEPHPVVQAKLHQQATTAEQEQASAQKAAAVAQAAGEAAQKRGQKALDTYQQDVQALTKQLTAAASHVRQAPALPGAHAASTKHKGGGGFWGAVLPIVGMVVLDGAEEFLSAGLATPAVAAEDAAIMGADAAATGAGEAATAAEGAASRWSSGDDIWSLTRADNNPAWSTVRGRYWKNVANDPASVGQWDSENLARMQKGLAPQRFNPDKGGMESMELSHEPIPARDGGQGLVPRWPQDHAAVDPFRFPGY